LDRFSSWVVSPNLPGVSFLRTWILRRGTPGFRQGISPQKTALLGSLATNDYKPIGSMYGIYANIWGIWIVNVAIYSIHGSYGKWNVYKRLQKLFHNSFYIFLYLSIFHCEIACVSRFGCLWGFAEMIFDGIFSEIH